MSIRHWNERQSVFAALFAVACCAAVASEVAADDTSAATPAVVQPPNAQPAASDAPTPNFGDVQSPNFGDIDTPNFGEVDIPNFGNLEGPDFSGLRNPDFSDVDTPGRNDVESPRIDTPSPQIDTPDSDADSDTNTSEANTTDSGNRSDDLFFTSPEEASGQLGESIPLRLDLESTVLARGGSVRTGETTDMGLQFDTTHNHLVVAGAAGALCEHCGLNIGDEVLAVERTWIRTYEQFVAELNEAIAGDGRAWVLVSRDGERLWVSFDLAVGLRPTLGVNTILDDGTVILSNVGSESAADEAGLRVGDVILTVNGAEVTSHGQLLDAIMLSALNDGRMEFVVLRDEAEHHYIAEVDRLTVEVTSGVGTDFTADSASDRAEEELDDAGFTFAAETIDSVFASANALLTAADDIAARTEGTVHDEAQTAAVLARELKDGVQEIDDDSPVRIQARLNQLIANVDELDRRLTSLAIQDLADAEESMATARESISELRESLDAINASISEGGDRP